MNKYPEDDQLLSSLVNGDETSWRKLYDEVRSPFRLFFIRHGCPPEEAIELFQEAMVIFHRKVTTRKLQAPMSSTIQTYIIGIGRVLMMRKGANVNQWETEIPDIGIEAEIESQHERKAKVQFIKNLLERLGGPCKRLLELFYLENYVMEAIAETMDLPSAGAARRRKHDCLKKMRALID
ncbi:MAG: sigma-70 family RNA polymerase sigma factor [Chitinophagales bacterium]|nr:sigma-70 family RNA polymerase sigma factor [Chitinophagales bacterium]